MRMRSYTGFTAVGVLALVLGAMPGAGGQEKPKPVPAGDEQCEMVQTLSLDQIRELESVRRNIRASLSGLRAQIAQEVAQMQPDKTASLSAVRAALRDLRPELDSEALHEMVAEAQEVAGQAEQEAPPMPPQVWTLDSGGESGWVGVEVGEVSAEKATELKLPAVRGVLVANVEPDSPAAKAGLKENDVIADFDHQAVEGVVQFRRLVRETPPGRSVPITVWRNGVAQSLNIEIGDRGGLLRREMSRVEPRFLTAPRSFDFNFEMPDFMFGSTPLLGISAEDLNGQLGAYFGAPGGEGVLVREVRSGSPAEKGGLKAGDVITKVGGETVKTVSQLRERLRDKRDEKTVALSVLRKGSQMTVQVELEKPKPVEHTRISRRAVL
jgi:serine protease Do